MMVRNVSAAAPNTHNTHGIAPFDVKKKSEFVFTISFIYEFKSQILGLLSEIKHIFFPVTCKLHNWNFKEFHIQIESHAAAILHQHEFLFLFFSIEICSC